MNTKKSVSKAATPAPATMAKAVAKVATSRTNNFKRPSLPYYMSRSLEVLWPWSNNYAAQLAVLGPAYNISADQIAQVTANAAAFDACMASLDTLDGWYSKWLDTRNGLMDPSPANQSLLVPFPDAPELPKPPAAVSGNVFGMHIATANIILNNPALTIADRDALGLVRAEGKPLPPEAKKRSTAKDFNYPLFKAFVSENGEDVVIRVTRGRENRDYMVLLQSDKEGTGKFVQEALFNTKEYTIKITLPEGVQTASWAFQAQYIDGQTAMSQFSPVALVAVKGK